MASGGDDSKRKYPIIVTAKGVYAPFYDMA